MLLLHAMQWQTSHQDPMCTKGLCKPPQGSGMPQPLEPAPGWRSCRCLTRDLPTSARELLPAAGLRAVLLASPGTARCLTGPNPDLLSQFSWLVLGSASWLETWLFLNCSAFLVWLLQDCILDDGSVASSWLANTRSCWAIFPWRNRPLVWRKPFTCIQLFLGSWNR